MRPAEIVQVDLGRGTTEYRVGQAETPDEALVKLLGKFDVAGPYFTGERELRRPPMARARARDVIAICDSIAKRAARVLAEPGVRAAGAR